MDEYDNKWIRLRKFGYIIICLLRGILFRIYRCFGCHVYTKHDVSDSLDTSQITYAMVWEDARTLRKALSIKSGDKVICVASGGDNALAMLLDDPVYIVAVDYSPAQIALCQLKQTAIKHLSYEDFILLLGVGDQADADCCRRVELYQEQIRDHLTRPLRRFWDKRLETIKHGLIYSGIYGKYFQDFARLIRPMAVSDYFVQDLFTAKSLDEQRAMVDTYFVGCLWKWLCKLYFGDVIVGRCPPFYERCDVNVGEHFYSRMTHALRNIPANDNYFLEYALLGRISGNHGLPEYLIKENYSVLKSRIDRVRFLRSDIADFMRDSNTDFDIVNLSNIFDFVPENEVKSHCEAAVKYASHGARLCHWTFVPIQDCSIYEQPFSEECKVDKELSKSTAYNERAWFYQTFVLQRVCKVEYSQEESQSNSVNHHLLNDEISKNIEQLSNGFHGITKRNGFQN